jgi:hypothetical protein
VTGRGLAAFLERFFEMGLAVEERGMVVKVRFGEAVDQDDRGMQEVEWEGVLGVPREIEWDIDTRCETHAEMVALLREGGREGRLIYRAFLMLGAMSDSLPKHLDRMAAEGEDRHLYLDSWSLTIGPVEGGTMDEEAERVGWMAVSMSGNGYLYPWGREALTRHLEGHAGVAKMMALCRETWGGGAGEAGAGWEWTVHETG